MRILYGVAGEGMGHATRSRVVIEALAREHELRVVTSGRARDYLAAHLPGVHGIWGLTLAYDDNAIRRWETVVQNLRGAVRGWPEAVREYYRLTEAFRPDAVITDFESFAHLYARRHRLPLICVDNIQVVDRCRHPAALIAGSEVDFWLARGLAAMKARGAAHCVVTSFFFPPVAKPRTTLVPPILRPEVLRATPARGEHLLVYQTAAGNEVLVDALGRAGMPARVYGVRRDLVEDVVEGPLRFRPFSEQGFVDDLASARGVIAGGGFSLLSEAVHLGKPVLSVPIEGQFEQVLNARYVAHLGYGAYAPQATAEVVAAFVEALPRYEEALTGYARAGNEAAVDEVRRRLDDAVGSAAP